MCRRLSDSVHRTDKILVSLNASISQNEKNQSHKRQTSGKARMKRAHTLEKVKDTESVIAIPHQCQHDVGHANLHLHLTFLKQRDASQCQRTRDHQVDEKKRMNLIATVGVKSHIIEQCRNAHTLRLDGSQRQAEADNDGCQCQQQENSLLALYHQIRSSLRSLSAGTSSAGFLQ